MLGSGGVILDAVIHKLSVLIGLSDQNIKVAFLLLFTPVQLGQGVGATEAQEAQTEEPQDNNDPFIFTSSHCLLPLSIIK